MKLHRCYSCGVIEGQLHDWNGCDSERCPFCGGQLSSCECCYKLLNIDVSEGTWAYENGLTKDQEEQWYKILTQKGRIPFVYHPLLCAVCGKNWPEFFKVSNREWKKFVIPELQDKIICKKCYNHIKEIFPNGWQNVNKVGVKWRTANTPTIQNINAKIVTITQ